MITRQITNINDPFVTPTGDVVVNSEVIFELVKTSTKKPISVFDALSGEFVNSKPFSFVTNATGEFSGQLWPNSRGEEQTCYKVTTEYDHSRPIYVTIVEGEGPISLIEARMNYQTISPPVISLFQATLASIHAQVNNAVQAIKVVTTTEDGMMLATDKVKLDGLNSTIDGLVVKTTTVNGKALTGNIVISAADLGLGSVNNTSDADKPISTAASNALALKAPLASPALTGTPTAPTAAGGTNTTQLATTAFVAVAVAPLATNAALTAAVAPLATAAYVDSAVAPLATRIYVDDSLALKTDSHTVDTFHASQTPAAGQIPVLTANNALVIGGGTDNGAGVDRIVVRGGGIFASTSDNTSLPYASKAALAVFNTYTAGYGYGATVKFGAGTAVNDFNQFGAISCVYDSYHAVNGLGGYMAFYTKVTTQTTPTERLRITSTGNVLIGTTTDDGTNKLQISGSAKVSLGANYSSLYVERNDQSGAGNVDRSLLDVMTATGAARFLQIQGGVTKNEVRLYPSGITVLGLTGDTLIGTATQVANAGKLQVAGGITFPAVQVASSNANTLDDYEEGTWTPVLTMDGTAGAGTYTLQEGTYTKIGRLVHVRCRIQWTAHTGTGTYMYVNGLPYGCVNASALSVWASNVVIGAGKQLSAYAASGLTRVTLVTIDLAGGAVANLAIDTAGDMFISGAYEV